MKPQFRVNTSLLFRRYLPIALMLLVFTPFQASLSANLPQIRQDITPTLEAQLAVKGLAFGGAIFVRVFKEISELEVWVKDGDGFKLFKTYPICTYSGGLGPKLAEGDQQSPEGFYSVSPAQMNPYSDYHLSFNLGFPNAYDRARGRTGSYLMVHGNCVSIGCYAMTDDGIEEIYMLAQAALENGQTAFQVHIFPFHMTPENLALHSGSEWSEYWINLQEGYDIFERTNTPPHVSVSNRNYVFGL